MRHAVPDDSAARRLLAELSRRQAYIKRVREEDDVFWAVFGPSGRLVALAPDRATARAAARHFGLEPAETH